MGRRSTTIIGGVDTHSATHHAAVIDTHGRLLGDAEFPATAAGYASMLTWMRNHGKLTQVGVEGTGAYGAGLARHLHTQGVEVLEVPRPDRRLRRQRGKSDPIDAESAARTVLAGKASGAPKLADGPIEAIRMLRVARSGAVKAKTAAMNTLRAMLVTAPDSLRTQLRGLTSAQLVTMSVLNLCGGILNFVAEGWRSRHKVENMISKTRHPRWPFTEFCSRRYLERQVDELGFAWRDAFQYEAIPPVCASRMVTLLPQGRTHGYRRLSITNNGMMATSCRSATLKPERFSYSGGGW
ncbi:IS110 family transposase [Mycolicibacterium hodleri]|uniref:IS110 family transposase n=1 Tax=Mycolicibacterium hodleri TaxID=49897 RepID=UPI001F46E2BD|nr:transposase [Mycolicibacterium hodleri]